MIATRSCTLLKSQHCASATSIYVLLRSLDSNLHIRSEVFEQLAELTFQAPVAIALGTRLVLMHTHKGQPAARLLDLIFLLIQSAVAAPHRTGRIAFEPSGRGCKTSLGPRSTFVSLWPQCGHVSCSCC